MLEKVFAAQNGAARIPSEIYALSCYRGYRSTTPTRPNTLITAANTAEAIKTRSTGESANGALEDECEDESTGESANGALNTEWRSGTLRMKLQGQELQQQQNHTRGRVRPVQTFLTPYTVAYLALFYRYFPH